MLIYIVLEHNSQKYTASKLLRNRQIFKCFAFKGRSRKRLKEMTISCVWTTHGGSSTACVAKNEKVLDETTHLNLL